jgi:hypothetical protein
MHGLDRRAVGDKGPWCFEGEHTTEQAVKEEEGWDNADLKSCLNGEKSLIAKYEST